MMQHECILLDSQEKTLTIKINRPEANNSITDLLVKEILDVLIHVEQDSAIKVIVLEGNQEHFCTGMDFKAATEAGNNKLNNTDLEDSYNQYYQMLKSITLCSKIVVAKVEGKVNAGGIGVVSASDIVIASEKATFGLSEALFGLLPACVIPFLMRRVGIQKAQWMTLITQAISANRAYEIGLVDEVSDNIQNTLRLNLLRLIKLETDTISQLKSYTSNLWTVNEQTQQLAVSTIAELSQSERVQKNIKNFVENGIFPWDNQ